MLSHLDVIIHARATYVPHARAIRGNSRVLASL